jgi:hypothetical protein
LIDCFKIFAAAPPASLRGNRETAMSGDFIQGLQWQAKSCRDLGSAFSAELLERAIAGELGPLDDLFAPGKAMGRRII